MRRVAALRSSVVAHDRSVVLGFAFSILPLFPVALVGLAFGLTHFLLHRAGKLGDFDYALARRGLMLAIVNSVLSILIVVVVLRAASGMDWTHMLARLPWPILEAIHFLFGGYLSSSSQVSV